VTGVRGRLEFVLGDKSVAEYQKVLCSWRWFLRVTRLTLLKVSYFIVVLWFVLLYNLLLFLTVIRGRFTRGGTIRTDVHVTRGVCKVRGLRGLGDFTEGKGAMVVMGPGKVLFLVVLLYGKKALSAEATARAGVETAPLGARAVFFSSVGASGTVVARGATGGGDCNGFAFFAAGKASVFEDLFKGNPDAEGFAYAIPIVVW